MMHGDAETPLDHAFDLVIERLERAKSVQSRTLQVFVGRVFETEKWYPLFLKTL